MKLTKTDFLIYRDCGKNAWLKIHQPDIYYAKPLSIFDQGVIDTGNEIDILARELFPGGTLIEDRNGMAETMNLLKAHIPVLYQPVFETALYKMISDVLIWNEATKKYDLYEVKASNSGEGKKAKDDLYIYDIAFQYVVLRELSVPIGRLNLVRLNAEYARNGDLNLTELFSVEDFTDRVLAIADVVEREMESAQALLASKTEPTGPCRCIVRGRSAHCTTFSYSNPEVPKYSVHDISRIGQSKKKLEELIDSDIFAIEDVPDDFPLSDKQKNQIRTTKTGKSHVDKAEIGAFLSTIALPISFLDYETFPAAVPRFDGYGPFNQIPFQFSLHVFTESSQEPTHAEFIFTNDANPDEAFIEALQAHVPPTGSVLVWHKSFEMGRNNDLAERNLSHKPYLEALNARIIDLKDIFEDQLYVHPGFKGKTSIKYVLPVLAPELSYKKLDIQEGATASDTWNKVVTRELSKDEAQDKIASLLTYCKLDTYAMFAIWKHLIDVV